MYTDRCNMSRRTATGYRAPADTLLAELHPERHLYWHDYADAWLNFPLGKVLDYGCGKGKFLKRIADRADECWGVDIDSDVVAEAGRRAGINALQIAPGQPLPFADEEFDTVISMEVIEHAADERALLREYARVLTPGGKLLLTTPHRGLLTFLDPGNIQFVAPDLHRFVQCTILGKQDYYQERFGSVRKSEQGMIADFILDQSPWHRHYAYKQIRTLAPDELRTLTWTVYYPAYRALWTLSLVLRVLAFGRVRQLPQPLRWLNNRLSRLRSPAGDQLIVLFEKKVVERGG